ncbi:smr (Small MutS Related) domain-containing protein [Abeliophyllum distichum]|uniref:Smr (Small MutS Related) domain-containing protein n=1 Tax=Abeliophyllum distichum TaxID=126358 RepID=A0ABD1SWC1_9LAMI
MSTSARERSMRVDRARTKANPGWAAFDLKHKRKQEGLSTEIDTESYPMLSGAVSSESLLKKDQLLLERPFSSVLSTSVNFPSTSTFNKDLDKQVPVVDRHFRTTQSNKVAAREDEMRRNAVELCKKLNELHPWADESLIKDVMTGLSNDVDKASTLLEAMVISENKEGENKLVESNYENNNTSLASAAASFGGTTDHPGPTGFDEVRLNETSRATMDNHTSFGKMLPCDGRNSSFILDATKFSLLEPEWEEDDVYLIHRKDAVRMMRSAYRHSKAANDAYLRGDHLSAQHFSLRAREEWNTAEQLNAKAAKEILRIRNCENDQWTLDLHGLHAAEAVQALQEHLHKVESLKSSNRLATSDAVNKEPATLLSASLESPTHNGLEKLRKQPLLRQRQKLLQVITGKGNNSKGAAALPPVIRYFLTENGYQFDDARPGVITILPKFRPQ